MRFYYERVEASRNFANKVWNASRFIMMNMEKASTDNVSLEDLTMADKWILTKCNSSDRGSNRKSGHATRWVLLFRRYMISSGKSSVTGTLRWLSRVCGTMADKSQGSSNLDLKDCFD